MRKIDIEECHSILLAIAKSVHEIGEKHGIKVYMVGGTMLGAIRHKGFIPWDDDMDFAIDYERYWEFMDILNNELPQHLRCSSYLTNESVNTVFYKVEDTRTRIDDPMYPKPLEKQQGINIDIFPLVKCDKGIYEEIIKKIGKLNKINRWSFAKTQRKTLRSKIAYYFLANKFITKLLPYSQFDICKRIHELLDKLAASEYSVIANPLSPNFSLKLLKESYFEPSEKYVFENTEFYGISDCKEYLTMLYKDYMKLPPVEKRIIHLDNVYII